MKDFMFIFTNPSDRPHPGPEEMQTSMQQWMAWIDKLTAENKYVAGEALMPEGKRVKGAKKLVTDGPFAESKEIVGGFFIVKVDKITPGHALAQPGLIGAMAHELQRSAQDDYAAQFVAAIEAQLKVKKNDSAIAAMKQRFLTSGS